MESKVAAVHIYGELFGGSYPHPQVEQEMSQPVQCGVWYAPGLHFQAFDVAVDIEGVRSFLSFEIAREACETCGLPFAVPLCTGTLSECLEYPVEFETTIPVRLGLPGIPVASDGTQNLAEGVVIRPLLEPPKDVIAQSGKISGAGRGLFKRKIAAFCEKKYQNNGWREGKAGGTLVSHLPA
jgi:Rnl2 family RNA ligase